MRRQLVLASLLAAACSNHDTGTSPGGTPSSANGFIFKGPLVKGSEIEWELLDKNAAETGKEGEADILNYLGTTPWSFPTVAS